jgi:hypothetical protein
VLALACLAASSPASYARIIQNSAYCANTRYTTHIVVVTEGDEIDGKVRVLESWKGDLKKGDEIDIPALAIFADPKERTLSGPFHIPKNVPLSRKVQYHGYRIKNWVSGKGPLIKIKKVTCKRMVVFLKKADGENADDTMWTPSSYGKDIKTAVIWVESGWTYAWLQLINPGPLYLTGPRGSEKDYKQRVLASIQEVERIESIIAAAKEAVEATKSVATAEECISLLRPHLTTELREANRVAIEALGREKAAALPTLIEIFEDEQYEYNYLRADVLQAMRYAGKAAGPYLLKRLLKEKAYWKETAPLVTSGWRKDRFVPSKEIAPGIEEHYRVTSWVIRLLGDIDYPECVNTVREFRDFWRSFPQMQDGDPLEPVAFNAERTLAKYHKNNSASKGK